MVVSVTHPHLGLILVSETIPLIAPIPPAMPPPMPPAIEDAPPNFVLLFCVVVDELILLCVSSKNDCREREMKREEKRDEEKKGEQEPKIKVESKQ